MIKTLCKFENIVDGVNIVITFRQMCNEYHVIRRQGDELMSTTKYSNAKRATAAFHKLCEAETQIAMGE